MEMENSTVRVMISGKVQNVWFRGWTKQRAIFLGIDGWVRNLQDGRVEALFSGPKNSVDAMIVSCAQGPPSANVLSVVRYPNESSAIRGFKVL